MNRSERLKDLLPALLGCEKIAAPDKNLGDQDFGGVEGIERSMIISEASKPITYFGR